VLCAVLVVLIRRVGTRWAPPLLAAGWTLLEWFHAQGALAFPWGTLAATQYRSLPVLQLLDLTGAYGLTFLMALLSASLALLLAPNLGGKEAGFRRSGAVWTCVSALLALASAGRGVWILQHPAPPGETARVAVVQASESRKVSGARVECISPFRAYEEGTRAAIREGAELVMWPESACVRDAVHDPEVDLRLKALLRGTRTHLLTGSFVQDYASGQATNAAVMRTPSGLVRGQYAKVQIVPFGEYLPLRPLLSWTERLGMPAEDLRAGDRWTPLGWRRGSVGVSICFESAFGPISRVLVDQGADLLAVLTSDGWVGRAAVGRQHAAFAPLRAVENRRSLARAAATGISELIDPYGRPLQTIPMFERGIAVADLPVRHDRTLYSRLGDWPVWLSWAILLGAACAGIWRPRERGSL
jgi:apolipoprotein N-acyltransferase